MLRVGVVSQKGGVGKSTLTHIIAAEFAAASWRVKIADLDVFQQTSVNWVAKRRRFDITPDIQVEPFSSVLQVIAGDADLLLYDGRPSSDKETHEIARVANAVVIPTQPSWFDMLTQVKLGQELVKHGTAPAHILFVINCATTDAESKDARGYIESANFRVAEHALFTKAGYRVAQNAGKALSETPHPSLRAAAKAVAVDIATFLEPLTP